MTVWEHDRFKSGVAYLSVLQEGWHGGKWYVCAGAYVWQSEVNEPKTFSLQIFQDVIFADRLWWTDDLSPLGIDWYLCYIINLYTYIPSEMGDKVGPGVL